MRPILRSFEAADAAAVLDAFADPEMARQGDVADLEQAAAWICAMTEGGLDRHVFAIDLDGTAVGAVGVTAIDRENRVGWFWYWLHRAHRGCGTASRAAATVSNWALSVGGLERLELGHRVNNPASGVVAEAAGFVREGVERGKFLIAGVRVDVLTYGRLITDPVPLTETFKLRE
ncbi:GNAT family N-acetyltransferase [Leekyejoonella antrihumi]|uniref:GNAT family N-acetyltransferase n=1 Tax=Leekyejoonella antrihumi TaxID=1660198 RepID=A0A563DRC6_9MICO|nr:GNAT family protein [Leekyejoonella antrihumi]TWP32746.1 GNAT family N-acetyltransferase [Leekyejoonella antrihumi]